MCDGKCVDHGKCVYVSAGYSIFVYPSDREDITEILRELNIERGRG